MRITEFITRSDTIGGAQVHVRDLSVHLQARGHDVQVLVGGDGPFSEDLRACGIPVQSLQMLRREIHPVYDVRAFTDLMRTLRAAPPDLLATHSGKAGWLGRLAGRLLGIPTVFTAHGWTFASAESALGRGIYRSIERLTAPLADRVITVSHCDQQLARAFKVVPEAKLRVVHNGVPDLPAGTAFAEPGRVPPRLITIARLQPPKDFSTLLHALVALRDLAWELDVVGDGPLETSVRAQIESLGLKGRVHLLGLRSDVADLIAQAQIAVLVSKKEGLPLSILEAMRASLPVVASDVGGVAEAVDHEVTGLLVPSEDTEALSMHLRRLITSASLRVALGRAGRARFEEQFTVERMVRETEQVYREAVQNHQNP